jgi:hypothetical protein
MGKKWSKKFLDEVFYISTFMRNFYAPGYSSITLSFFNWNLSLRFYRYSGKNNVGRDHYDLKNGVTTTVDYDSASCLHQVAMFILDDINSEKEIRGVLQCNNAALIFEYKREQDNQMAAYLTIEKNDQSISFRFRTHTAQVMENGQMVTRVVQSGLGAFANTLESYLTGTGISYHLNKMLDTYEKLQDENQQASNTTTADNGYPYEYS